MVVASVSKTEGLGSIPGVLADGETPTVLDDMVWFKKGHDGVLLVGVLQQDCKGGVYWEHVTSQELLKSIATMVDIACELDDITLQDIDDYLLP